MSAARVLYRSPLISPSRRITCGGSGRKKQGGGRDAREFGGRGPGVRGLAFPL